MSSHITATTIIELLAEKHSSDVFVPECNTGSSWAGCQRMDAWAMRTSWSRFGTVGYEVKVSRSDFEQDQKWTGYLDYCHELLFVCPGGLIKAHELPPEVGLLWVSQNKQKLHTKRKAKHREIDPANLVVIMAYVLMSRTRIMPSAFGNQPDEEPEDRLTIYREWVEDATERKTLAHFVNAHIRSAYNVMKARVENAERLEDAAEMLRKALAELGIEWDTKDSWGTWKIEREIDKLAGRIPKELFTSLEQAKGRIEKLQEVIEGIQGSDGEAEST